MNLKKKKNVMNDIKIQTNIFKQKKHEYIKRIRYI